MDRAGWLPIFDAIGEAFNSALETHEMLEHVAQAICSNLGLTGCHFRLVSRDRQQLEHVVAVGLSDRFINKGPVLAERSVAEALEGKIVAVPDCVTDPRIQYPDAFSEEGLASMLTVPLASRGQVIGVMRLFSAERRVFTPGELEVLEVAASFCSSAILHAMFQQILRLVTQSIRTSLDLDQVLDSIVTAVRDNLRAKGCFLALVTDNGPLEVVASTGFSDDTVRTIERQPGAVLGRALEGQAVQVMDAVADGGVPFVGPSEPFASLLAVPLTVRDAAIGILTVATNHPYEFSDDELYLMGSVGEQCALAIRNAQMYDAMKKRYHSVVDDFHQWFEHYQTYPRSSGEG